MICELCGHAHDLDGYVCAACGPSFAHFLPRLPKPNVTESRDLLSEIANRVASYLYVQQR